MAAAAVAAVPVPADGIAHSSVHVILPACCLTAPPPHTLSPPLCLLLVAYFQFTKFQRCMSTFAYFMEYLMNFNFALPLSLCPSWWDKTYAIPAN